MLQSSAYRTKRCLRRSSSRSSSSSTMFDRSGERGPLRCPFSPRTHQPVLQHSHFQERSDQSEHSLVGHPPCDRRHQFVVVDPIKELLKIEVYHPAMALSNVLLCLGY